MKIAMLNFNNMTSAELSVWHIANVVYDIGAETPNMLFESHRKLCAEAHELQNEVSE